MCEKLNNVAQSIVFTLRRSVFSQIWYIVNSENGTMQLELAADLKRHQRSVNAVRWSPCGTYLATGDDESIIFIWRMKNDSEPVNICGNFFALQLLGHFG